MRSKRAKDLNRVFVEDGRLIDRAIKKGVRDAILRHKAEGFPVVVYRKGKTILVPPGDIDV